MKVSYLPTGINNFHNSDAINLVVSPATIDGNTMYRISASQAKRIEKHFCGTSDCRCAHGAAQQLNAEGTEWGIFVKWCEA